MKTLTLAALLHLSAVTESVCQAIGYYLPEKKLRITVTYNLKGYALQGLSDDTSEAELDRRFDMMISKDITVEEIIVPDKRRYFELTLPQQLAKGGARFDWSLKLDRNAILAGWNASREPISAEVISGGIGLVTNLLTGLAHVRGALPGGAETSYKVVTDQDIKVTQIIDIPRDGLSETVVAIPELNASVAAAIDNRPAVSVAIADAGIGSDVTEDERTDSRDVIQYIAPRYYHLTVMIDHNGLSGKNRVIDHFFAVPQHGQLRQIAVSALFRGRKSAGVGIDPSTGQLLTWQHQRSGSTKATLADINKQLESFNDALSGIMTAQDQKLKQEVARLELELERIELLRKLQE